MISHRRSWIVGIALLSAVPIKSAAESALGCITEAEFKGDPVSTLDLKPTPPGATVRELRLPHGEAHTFDRQGRLIRTRKSTTYEESTITFLYSGASRLPHEIRLTGDVCCNGVTRYERNSAGFVESSTSTGKGARDFRYDIIEDGGDVLVAPRGVADRHRFREGWRIERRSGDNLMLNPGNGTTVAPSPITYRCERVENPDGTWFTVERKNEGNRSGIRETSKYDANGNLVEQWSAFLNQPLSESMLGTTRVFKHTFDEYGNWITKTSCTSRRDDRADLDCSDPNAREIRYW
jgi:hypothetical protein